MSRATRLDRTLGALADPHRRGVVDLLRKGPRAASEIAGAMGLSPPAMSRHLRVLRESGLVEESHPAYDARLRIYSLKTAPIRELRAWLEETEELWAAELAAFKAHIESAP